MTRESNSGSTSEVVVTGGVGTRAFAWSRIAHAVYAFVAPRRLGRVWIGANGTSERVSLITRAFAIRDLALGLGLYRALERGVPARGWIEAAILCDAGDAIAALGDSLPVRRRLALVAGAGFGVACGILVLKNDNTTTNN